MTGELHILTASDELLLEREEGVDPCNHDALLFWRRTGYARRNVLEVCRELNERALFAHVSFLGDGSIDFTVSTHTWKCQEGHFPTMAQIFAGVARHPLLEGVKGDLIVWLEDGMWDWHRAYGLQAPMLVFGRHSCDSASFLIPDPAFWGDFGYRRELASIAAVRQVTPWEERFKTAFWRGAASGIGFYREAWRDTPRGRLVLFAKELAKTERLDAALSRIQHIEEGCRSELIEAGIVAPELPFHEFCRYRYLLDVDGQCCAWKSLFFKLASGSVVLKLHSPYQQWFYRLLRPWEHYIPVSGDLRDFEAIYEWLLTHDDDAREIADNGRSTIATVTFERALEDVALLCRNLLACQHE